MLIWYVMVVVVGLLVGGLAAWSQGSLRVFMRTFGIPLALLALRFGTMESLRGANFPLFVLRDYLLMTFAAFCGDYLAGRVLGRNDSHGYRSDSVGH